MKYILLLIIGLNFGFTQDEIPQGTFQYELYFSEWDGRILNTSINVIITGTHIKLLKNEKTNLSGENLIFEGILMKNDSGIWIIGNDESDKHKDEIGGCTGEPIPIDFEKKIVEWC